jgi:hypothetical protein
MNIITLTREDMFDSDLYDTVEHEFTNHTRWSIWSTVVVRRRSDDTFWRGTYDEGATEYQDSGYDGDVEFEQVYPVKKTMTVYVDMTELHAHEEKTIPND